ncbi:hypothetical protein [Kribbella catacumbae]|uniref:hypothetical protein n=1 Tax=Kribbella catacumbae TaxID=460086 RepID=UPI000372E3AB|nr:hypothetical protein [Kribbella catacumbae]
MVKTLTHKKTPLGLTQGRASLAEPAAAAICDQHGAALSALAEVVAGDSGSAQAAVVAVIVAAFPATTMAVPMAPVEMRRHLARRVYRQCGSGLDDTVSRAGRERVVLALAQHGRLTYRAAGDLLGLPASETAQLLNSALRRASATTATPSTQ